MRLWAALIYLSVSIVHARDDSLIISNFTDATDCDYLIVSPDQFIPSALALAAYRNSNSKDAVECARVIRLETIINRYTVSLSDPLFATVRAALMDASKCLQKLRFVVLIGDERVQWDRTLGCPASKGIMPSYLRGYSILFHNAIYDTLFDFSDDFFLTSESPSDITVPQYDVPFCIGRIPCETVAQCSLYVEKVKRFENCATNKRRWRNSALFIADDIMQNKLPDPLGFTHFTNAEQLCANRVFKGIAVSKVYMSAYNRENGERPFAALADLKRAMERGVMWTVFFGHGSSVRFADESLLTGADAVKIHNETTPTVICSFSCLNGSYQNPFNKSMCKQFLFADGGAVAYLASSTLEYSGPNEKLASSFFQSLDFYPSLSLGELFVNAKRTVRKSLVYHYQYLGDPAIKLMESRSNVRIKTYGVHDKIFVNIMPEDSRLSSGFITYSLSVPRTIALLDDPSRTFISDSVISVADSEFTGQFTIPVKIKHRPLKLIIHIWNDSADGFTDTTFFMDQTTAFNSSLPQKDTAFSINRSIVRVTLPVNLYSGDWGLIITDLRGRVIARVNAPHFVNSLEVNLASIKIASGNYIIALKAGNDIIATRHILKK
jgi:hypothetical protein